MADGASTLQIIVSATDQASAVLGQIGQNASSDFQTIIDNSAKAGAAMLALGGPITAAVGFVVNAASQNQVANTQLNQTFKDQIAAAQGAADANTGLATQIAFLKDKIDGLKASNDKLAETHEKTAGAEAKRDASIQSNIVSINKYQQQLDILTSQQDMASESADALMKQFEQAADSAAGFGFSATESIQALDGLQRITGNVNDTMKAFQAAENLARAQGISLAEAENELAQGLAGRGMQLKTIGVNVAEGIGGMQVIDAVMQKVGGDAQAFNGTLQGQTDITQAKFQDLAAQLGTQLIPILTTLMEKISDVITKIEGWVSAHQQLATRILEVMAVLGPLLTVIGSFLIVLPMIVAGVEAVILIFGALMGPMGAVIIIIGVLAALWIQHHQEIEDTAKKVWGAVTGILTTFWNDTKKLFDDGLKYVENAWTNTWNGMETFVGGIWTAIKNTVRGGINDMISVINGMINNLDSMHITLPSVTIPGTKTTIGGNTLGFNIPNIPTLATGGIVTGPTLALIGEAGPEAVLPLSGSGAAGLSNNIIININGGIFPADQSSIQRIGNMLARSINTKLKLRTT